MKKTNKNHLRIAMYGHKRVPGRESGIEVVVWELATRMALLGHEVTCYNRKGHHVSGKEFDSKRSDYIDGVKIKELFTVNGRGLAALTSSIAGAFATAFGKYDVVHIHAEGPACMCWLPKLLGKRVIVTIHGLDWQRAKWGKIAASYIRLGEKNAARYADEIIVLSKKVQHYFLDAYGRETRYIPNGMSIHSLVEADEIKKLYGLNKNSYILYLGRIVPEKGIQYLIEAWKKIETDKKLVIAGGSSDTEIFEIYLKDIAKDDQRIIFTGFIQGKVLEEMYSNCYLYVLPSDLEGMSMTLLEALSYGCSCLTSDIDECTEVLDDKGITFHKGDVENLREKIQGLIDKKETNNQIKQMIVAESSEKFQWNRIVKDTINVYFNYQKE